MPTINNTSQLATAAKVIAIAKAEVGYKEKASNANLDDKNANAGAANYTKYARDFDTKYPNWYNGKKNGFEWCDMFVDWCFLTAFGYKKALELLCQPEKSTGAGCIFSYGFYAAKKQAGREPKIGAQIFFGNSANNLVHTGLVYDFDDKYVYTIEGNSGNMVAYHRYDKSASNFWYGYPKYDEQPQTEPTSLTKGMVNDFVKKMQTMLIKVGYSCGGVDGFFGDYTFAALKKFQKDNKIIVDGIYGPQSRAKLIEVLNRVIAKQVIDGKWGNGADRENKLKAAGYDYDAVQNVVNEIIKEQKIAKIKVDYARSFNKNIAGMYTTTAKLNLRTGAGPNRDIILVMPKGAQVKSYGYYTNDWYYVKYDGYTGFCEKAYLTR